LTAFLGVGGCVSKQTLFLLQPYTSVAYVSLFSAIVVDSLQ